MVEMELKAGINTQAVFTKPYEFQKKFIYIFPKFKSLYIREFSRKDFSS